MTDVYKATHPLTSFRITRITRLVLCLDFYVSLSARALSCGSIKIEASI